MADIEISLNIRCNECGGSLTYDVGRLERQTDLEVAIDPCDACLEKARDEGRKESD